MTNIVQAPEELKAEIVHPVADRATGLGGDELLTNFNEVIQASLGKMQVHLDKVKAIIRCDNLPYIDAKENDIRQLCDNLIGIILQHPPQKSKLFIYIKSNRTESNIVQSEVVGGLNQYDICFHTNSCNEPSWQAVNKEQIVTCEAICKQCNGRFTYAFGHADYLFKLTLPGKLF